jgi:HK97 family phage major capsid protein
MTPDTQEMPAYLRGKPEGFDVRAMTVEMERAVGEDGEPTGALRIAISSEEPYERQDWWTGERYLEVLDHRAEAVDLRYVADGMPFCLDHDLGRMVGIVENVSIDSDRRMRGTPRQGNHPDAAWAFKDLTDGIRKKVSVGYVRGDYEVVTLADGREARRYRWMPYEASSVPVPADYTVGVGRSAAGAAPTPETNAPAETPEGAKEQAMAETLIDAPDNGVKAEGERVKALRDLGKKYGMVERALDWIAEGRTVEQAKDDILAKQATDAPTVFVRSPEGPIGRDGAVKDEFDSAGEFFRAVARAAMAPHQIDPRLKQRAVSGNSEGLASEGGFAVTKPVQMAVTEDLWNTGAILPRVNRIPVTGNGIKLVRVDETSRADGSRGGAVTAEWTQEGGKPTAGKIKLREHNLDLKKLVALGYATEELLEDAPALEAEMVKAFRNELVFKAENAIVNGTGNGQPLGILQAPALVTQAIEVGQTIANTPANIAANISAMLSRIPAPLWADAVLIANPSHLPTFVTATVGDQRIYIPQGTAGMQLPTILGIPVIWSEYPAAKNSAGDLILASLSQYDVAEKAAGPGFATSAHLRFDYGEMTFRFTYRIDGQPGWRSSVTPLKGADNKSPFVTLAVRS